MTECPQCGYDLNSCDDCAVMFDGGPVKRLRRWLCQRFGWHSKAWVSPADRFDTCLACGERRDVERSAEISEIANGLW
jgi:hypothetical protein